MRKVRQEDRHIDLGVKFGKGERHLRVVEIRYVSNPDAGERLSRAIAILLNAAARYVPQPKIGTDTREKGKDGPTGDEGDFHR